MPFALMWGAIDVLLVLPLVGTVWLAARRRLPHWRGSECFLLALLILPCIVLAEMLVLGFLPMDRPLRLLLPWVHLGILGAVGIWLVARHRAAGRERRRVARRLMRVWRAGGPGFRVTVGAAAVAMGAAFAYSAWNAGDEHDGAMYRLVVVMQPWQDGRIGHVTHPWYAFADAYPRTVELLASWTVLCTGNTVGVLLVNWYGLVVFAAAAYVVGRRVGLSRRWSLSIAALVATTPLPIYLTCVLYDDLPVGAWLTAALALAMRPRWRVWTGADLAACCLALALAMSAKFSAVPPAGLIGALLLADSFRPRVRARAVRWWAVAGGLAASVVIASGQYVRSWVLFGSPLWPLKVSFGGTVVFDGPLQSDWLYTVARGSWGERWMTALYKLFQTTSQDANGSFGVLFAAGVIPAAVVGIVLALRRPRAVGPNVWFVLALFFSAFLVPEGTVLRYSLYMLAPGYAIFIVMMRRSGVGWVGRALPGVVAVMLLVNIADWGRAVAKEVAKQVRSGISLTSPERNRDWYMRFSWISPGIDASMHAAVHGQVHPGERLVYAVNCLPGLLYDNRFTYAIEYRSVASWADPQSPPDVETATDAQIRAWLVSLRNDGIDAVLVHAGSVEDVALASPGSGFSRSFEGKPGGEQPAANIYRREALP